MEYIPFDLHTHRLTASNTTKWIETVSYSFYFINACVEGKKNQEKSRAAAAASPLLAVAKVSEK